MENLEMIIHILYKRVPVQEVIAGKLRCDAFDEKEFLRMVSSYVFHYSENEAINLLNYYTYIFGENARITGRKVSSKLNVFDALFYCAFQFLCIKNNEILCRYDKLMEWRKVALELGENLFVTAYLAARVSSAEVLRRGFTWKRVLNHDNVQINMIMERGYSENHFHLNGSAPIFHISWISLMNNINSSRMAEILAGYDRDRRYVNAAYTSGYRELPFYTRALQAVLIRLLLYSKLSGRALKIDQYYVETAKITGLFDKSLIGDEKYLISRENLEYLRGEVESLLKKHVYSVHLSFIIDKICSDLATKADFQHTDKKILGTLRNSFGKYTVPVSEIREVLDTENSVNFPELFIKILNKVPKIELEDARDLISDTEAYDEIWEQITLETVLYYLKNPDTLSYNVNLIQSVIDAYRMSVSIFPGQDSSLDYAIQETNARNAGEDANILFAGERWLMYRMFQNIYSQQEIRRDYYNLFYAYLIIKESIRSELIQTNSNVGFSNFYHYQKRKGDLLADKVYNNAFVKLAVSENLLTKNTKRLELRLCPAESVEKMRKDILKMDKLLDPDTKKGNRFFYTLHFIKTIDKMETRDGYCYCRHWRKRKQVGRQALAIVGLREKYPLVGRRILGIDAASNEIGCRPEVFAPVFRRLKEHRWSYVTAEGVKKLPQLCSTYHVGEDFLDLADGLRAINEAVSFLGLGSGDRLGHALALGVDAEEWYSSKNYRVVLPRQDYLDNLVWIYHKLAEFDIQGFENLKEWILGEFAILFSDIYDSAMDESERECILKRAKAVRKHGGFRFHTESNIFNYYYAWMLRGDSPELYEDGFFNEDIFIRKSNAYSINSYSQKQHELRYHTDVALLYYMYHYNYNVRTAGGRIEEFLVSKLYVKAVSQIQAALQKEIASRGIAIETNPSSNFLIGTFRKYEKHPIIRFYNKKLQGDPECRKECPQIPVSVNTDDQGVFNTTLENEYGLLASALESLTDSEGEPLYNRSDIYDWLDAIRNMGNDQSFGAIADMKDEGAYYR